MNHSSLPKFVPLMSSDTFAGICDQLIHEKIQELRAKKQLSSSAQIHDVNATIDVDDYEPPDVDCSTHRPRRTASKNAVLKIKENVNIIQQPTSEFSGILTTKTTRTKVIKKNTTRTKVISKNERSEVLHLPLIDSTNNMASAAEKSIQALDEMNLVKIRTKQFESMTKDQLETVANKKAEVENCIPSTALDNVNNNVVAGPSSAVVLCENINLEENAASSTTTTTTRVTRTKTRNLNKQLLTGTAIANDKSTEVENAKPKGTRTKKREDLKSKLIKAVEKDRQIEIEALAQLERQEAMAQKVKEEEEELARKAKEEEAELARKAKEEAQKAADEKEKRKAKEEKLAAEEKKEALAKKAKKEKEALEKRRIMEEAEKKREEEESNRRLAVEKKKLELEEKLQKKREAVKKKHEALNEKRTLAAKKREEMMLASASKKKEAAIADAKAKLQPKVAEAKENMRCEQNEKHTVKKPLHPAVDHLKKIGSATTTYTMTPPRDERPPAKPKTVNDYGIDDASASDSSDDENNPKKLVPAWAKSSEMVNIQSQIPLKLMQWMMSCETDPYRTLGYMNRMKRPRTSSAVWETPIMSKSMLESWKL